jgi:hypothetical protein
MSRAFKMGSLKSFAWMAEVIALSSVWSNSLKLLQAPRKSTPATVRIVNRSCALCIIPSLKWEVPSIMILILLRSDKMHAGFHPGASFGTAGQMPELVLDSSFL